MINIIACGEGEFNIQFEAGQQQALKVCAAHSSMNEVDYLASLIGVGLATQVGMIAAQEKPDEDSP